MAGSGIRSPVQLRAGGAVNLERKGVCMKIGIYGGTFNPPHLGHLEAARTAVKVLELDKLILIPAAVPPHKALPGGDAGRAPTVWP